MQFLLLIHQNETDRSKQDAKTFARYMAYTKELREAGVYRSGEPLEPSTKGAAKVSVREGKTRVVDGPFAEAKEVLGGFYLIDCASLEDAKKWAAKCPGAEDGTMEVRQIMMHMG